MIYLVYAGIKESGGEVISPWQTNIRIVRGQHLKLGIAVLYPSGRAVTVTNYTVKLRLALTAPAVLEKTCSAIDNTKGELEVELSPTDTNTLVVGASQSMEIEIFLTATPTTTSFHTLQSKFTVADQLLDPP